MEGLVSKSHSVPEEQKAQVRAWALHSSQRHRVLPLNSSNKTSRALRMALPQESHFRISFVKYGHPGSSGSRCVLKILQVRAEVS